MSEINGSIHVWDVGTEPSLRLLHTAGRSVYDLAFRPDGRWLAAACLDGNVLLWDCARLAASPSPPDRILSGGNSRSIWSLAYSSDGSTLATGSEQGVITLWDAERLRRVVTLRGGTGQIRGLSFSRDGGLLAGSAYVSRTIVWDLVRLRSDLRALGLDWGR
jgi:WD40 repeat protein